MTSARATSGRSRADDRRWLLRFVGLAGLLSFALAAVQLVFTVAGFVELRASVEVQSIITLGIATAWIILRRGGSKALAVSLVGYSTLFGTVAATLYVRLAVGSLVVIPLFAIALVLPYLEGWRMWVFVTLALASELLVAERAFVSEPLAMPLLERAFVGIGTVTLMSALAIGLLLRFSSQTRRAIASAERALLRERQLAESIPNMVFVTTTEGNVTFTNSRWGEYTGLGLDETSARGLMAALHPEDRARANQMWKRALRSKQPLQMEVRVRQGPEGPYRWHLSRAVPLCEGNGRPLRWFGTLTDIDDQKQAEARLQFLAEASAVLGASLDLPATLEALAQVAIPRLADWCVIHIRDEETGVPIPAAVAGADPERARRLKELMLRFNVPPSEDRPTIFRAWSGQAVLQREVTEDFIQEVALFPGHVRQLEGRRMTSAILVPLMARGRVFGVVTLVASQSRRRFDERDLTIARELADRAAQAAENARLYLEAQEAVKAREDFLSVASHELKTPLTSLLLMVRTVQKLAATNPEQLTPDKLPARIEVIARQVTRLERLINALLDVSRISAQRHRLLEPERLDLTQVASEVVNRMRPDCEQLKCQLRLHVDGPLQGRWDRMKLEQILTNLISNAAKFGAAQPIDVTVRGRAGRAVVTVRDRGRGIAPEDQARIFERFERAVSQRQVTGMGLGLWIVRQLVEAMGGNIRVESEPGKGATFTVDLPLEVSTALEEEPRLLH